MPKEPRLINWSTTDRSEFARTTIGSVAAEVLKFLISKNNYDPAQRARKVVTTTKACRVVIPNLLENYLAGRKLLITSASFEEYGNARLGGWPQFTTILDAMFHEGFVIGERDGFDGETDQFQRYLVSFSDDNGLGLGDWKGKVLNHSRLFDVHTWSDHPEVNTFVNEIFASHFDGVSGNTNIRKKHIKVLLLDLYVAWKNDPKLFLGFNRAHGAYKAKSRYNELNISKVTPEVIDRLEEVGLVNTAIGYHSKDSGKSRTSRLWPTPRLVKMFEEARFGTIDIINHEKRECIILRDEDRKEVEYDNTPQIVEMRESLTRYNQLLFETFIDIPELENPFITIENGNPVYVNQNDKFVRRIFNRESWDKGGRFYGGWWQRIPKEWRHKIFLNDQPVSEIDYSGLHIVMLYAEEGIDYWRTTNEDPYTVDELGIFESPERQRAACKSLMLVLINARNERSAFKAFRRQFPTGAPEKHLKDMELRPILAALREKHAPVAHRIASDAGVDLMNQDGQITQRIMDYFTVRGIPILTVHDSYLVPMNQDLNLKLQMELAFEAVTGTRDIRLKEETHDPFNPGINPGTDTELDAQFAFHHQQIEERVNPERSLRYAAMLGEFCEYVRDLSSGIQ